MFYMSFCDPDRPEGTQFLGAIMTYAPDFMSAIMKTHALGINPGGEVAGCEVPDDLGVPEEFIDRLLSKDEVDRFDAVMDARKTA